jgi:uncharacterized protein (DUF1800 family)
MEITRQLKNQHLLWRAGFGPSANSPYRLDHIQPHKLYRKLEKASAAGPRPIDTVSAFVKEAMETEQDTDRLADDGTRKRKNAMQRREINRQSNQDIRKMTLAWMDEMTNSEAQLREKMALFWHGHFACRVNNSLYQQLLLQTIRQHALGHFGDLLRAVSKSASMLSFLNNQQNRKRKPNENFAREVMELFTIGRGHYTEKDIKEAARAFTGWGFERNGTFVFREKVHDDGSKTILGSTGTFNGDDVLNLILQQKETARYLCRKIYRHFVNEQVNDGHVTWLAQRFYDSDYDIGKLLRDIFTSDWLYEEQNIGTHIKSPVEYLVGLRRQLPMNIRNSEVQVLLQRLLGQWLFNPPNVAGWPGGRTWIDSSSLMLRLRIPGLIQNDEAISMKPKGNDDVEMGSKEMLAACAGKPKKAGGAYRILATVDWQTLYKNLGKPERAAMYGRLSERLLQIPVASPDKDMWNPLILNSSDDSYWQTLTIALMSIPEYQLC